MQLYATPKLFEKFSLQKDALLAPTPSSRWLYDAPPLAKNPLGGWHGRLIRVQRRNCVLLLHDTTRFPLVLPALVKPDYAEFNYRFADALLNTLSKCGLEPLQLYAMQEQLRPLQLVERCDQSVRGILEQLSFVIEHTLWEEKLKIADLKGYGLSAWLADLPAFREDLSPIWPHEAMQELAASLAQGAGLAVPARQKPGKSPSLTGNGNVISLQPFRFIKQHAFD